MDFIISLAHFCEVHGPKTIICTQLAPITCGTCFPITTPPSEHMSKTSSFDSSFWDPNSPAVTPGTAETAFFSPFTSPPTSPKSPNGNCNPYFGGFGAGTGAHAARRFSMDSDAEYESCDNCNFLLPKSVSDMLPDGAPGSPTKNGRGQNGSPIMRTTQPIVAYGSSEDTDDEEDSPTGSFVPHTAHLGTSPGSALGSSTASSPLYAPKTHIHNLTYITRRHPESHSVYSRLRHSCLRTLASEQLPKSAHTGALVFGDSIAGHTIAYIFKLPDYRSRGKRKTYALTALGRDSWRVMGAMVQVTKAFESIAGQIVSMADRVFERESAISARPSIPDLLRTPPLSSSLPVAPVTPTPGSPQADRAKSSANSPVSSQRAIPDVSSFLAAKKVDPDGYPRVSRELMRAKGLSEIVGNDNFYLELHAQFCVILANLVKELSR